MPNEYAAHGNYAVRVIRLIPGQDRDAQKPDCGSQAGFHLMINIEVLEYFALYIHNAKSNTEEFEFESGLT